MKRSKNTVKNKLIATLMLGLTITVNATTLNVGAMYSSKAGAREATIAAYRSVRSPRFYLSTKEQDEIQQVVKAILSMMINPSTSNVALVKKLYDKTTDYTVAELLYYYLLDIKNKQKLPILSDLQVPIRKVTRYSRLSGMGDSLKSIISAVLKVKSSPLKENAPSMISFYNSAEFIEKTIIYNQMLALAKEDNICAIYVLRSISVPLP